MSGSNAARCNKVTTSDVTHATILEARCLATEKQSKSKQRSMPRGVSRAMAKGHKCTQDEHKRTHMHREHKDYSNW